MLKTSGIVGNESTLAEIHFLCACIALVYKMCVIRFFGGYTHSDAVSSKKILKNFEFLMK